MWDSLYVNATIATMTDGIGLIENAALGIKDGKIVFAGEMDALPKENKPRHHITDLKGALVTPGLIDCHTHLVYGGSRFDEFHKRNTGMSYSDIAKAGGGILSTVRATRDISQEQLLQESVKRARALHQGGVTRCEIKSGYGLDKDTEIKMLRVAKDIEEHVPISVHRTYLGAHCVPPEYQSDVDSYVRFICDEMLPFVKGEDLAESCDVFCESIAFSLDHTREIFEMAQSLDLTIKCHAEQLSASGATLLACSLKALSCEHLEYLDIDGVMAMVESGTVAVLLPGAYYYLQETQKPPIEALRSYNVPMAIGTDCNPGSSPTTDLLLMCNMACQLYGLTGDEALLGVTKNAALALGLKDVGTIEKDKIADICIWDCAHSDALSSYMGYHPINTIIKEGKVVFEA